MAGLCIWTKVGNICFYRLLLTVSILRVLRRTKCCSERQEIWFRVRLQIQRAEKARLWWESVAQRCHDLLSFVALTFQGTELRCILTKRELKLEICTKYDICKTKDTIDPFFFFVPWQVMAIEIDIVEHGLKSPIVVTALSTRAQHFFSLWSLCNATLHTVTKTVKCVQVKQ